MDEGFDQRVGPPEVLDASGAAEYRAPGIGTVLAAFATGFALAALLGGAGVFLFQDSLAALFFLAEVGLLGGVVAYLAASGRRVAEDLRAGPVPTATYPLAVKLGIALLLANFAATALLGPPIRDIEFVAATESAAERIVLTVTIALAAPVIEEALFRGLLQGALEARLRPWLAIALAAMPFALLHGPLPAIFFFFWSLPVGWVTWRTGSIRPGVVVHALNNMVGLIGLLTAGSLEAESVERGAGAMMLAVAVLVLAALWAVRLCRRIGLVAGATAINR